MCSEGEYYDMEVEVPGSDSGKETLTASPTPSSEVTEVSDDVSASDPAYEPLEFISLVSGAVSHVEYSRCLVMQTCPRSLSLFSEFGVVRPVRRWGQ